VDLDWPTDTDDEYILQCTQAGTLATAVFSLRSVNGDTESGIQFADGVASDQWVRRVSTQRSR
jgi:hypothetical protein